MQFPKAFDTTPCWFSVLLLYFIHSINELASCRVFIHFKGVFCNPQNKDLFILHCICVAVSCSVQIAVSTGLRAFGPLKVFCPLPIYPINLSDAKKNGHFSVQSGQN